ncbi:MAG: TraX family protein [Cytophagales bacterium]|nr:TraX family protein [Cytophagales bacterium]
MNETSGNLNTDFLKLIGIITMVIDHFGKVFYEDNIWFQLIGRITFPIFAYCLVIGFLRTKDLSRYFLRLFTFSVISQPIYTWLFGYPWSDLNIFFTLILGLFSIHGIRSKQWVLVAIAHLVPIFLKIDYGVAGIVLIDLIYVFRKSRTWSIIWLIVLFVSQLFINITEILQHLMLHQELVIEPNPSLNVFGLLSIPLLYIHINLRITVKRSVFYVFYPLHLFVLLIMKNLYNLLS